MRATQMEIRVSRANASQLVKTITVANVLMDTKVKKFANTSAGTSPHAAPDQNLEFVSKRKRHIYVYVILKVIMRL